MGGIESYLSTFYGCLNSERYVADFVAIDFESTQPVKIFWGKYGVFLPVP
jgi:hypothetical protein